MIFHQTRRSLLKPITQFIFTSLLVCWFVVFGSGVNAITTGYLTEQGELFRQVLAAAKLTPDDLKQDQAVFSYSRFHLHEVQINWF